MEFNTRELFKILGFKEDWDAIAEQLPGYKYVARGVEITVSQVTNEYLRPCFLVLGCVRSPRSIEGIEFEIPVQVESFEQGLAWLVYGVGKHKDWLSPPAWMTLGRQLEEHLPWVRRQQAYKNRPVCNVDRQWFRLAAKQLRDLAATAAENDRAIFSFDGAVLRIEACSQTLAMPAKGNAPWVTSYAIPANQLDHLPQRFATASVNISVFDDRLSVANRAWRLAFVGKPLDPAGI